MTYDRALQRCHKYPFHGAIVSHSAELVRGNFLY